MLQKRLNQYPAHLAGTQNRQPLLNISISHVASTPFALAESSNPSKSPQFT